MDRAIPEISKVLSKKQLLIAKAQHKERIREAQSSVDNRLPSGYYYPINKRNTEVIIEGNSKIFTSI